MNRLSEAIAVLAALGCTLSCSLKETVAAPADLQTDKDAIAVEADNVTSADPFAENQTVVLTDTIMVTATRSWTVSVETADGGDWIKPSVIEHINVSGIADVVELVLTFDRYKGKEARRADLIFACAELGERRIVPVTQQAFEPSLELVAKDDPTGVSANGQECYVVVRSNTKWKLSVDAAESTVVPVISNQEGDDTQAVCLSFPANEDDELARFATLVATAEGCEPRRIEYVQTQSERFFYLSEEVPSEIIPYQQEVFIPLRSNGPWTAELTECTFENATITPAAGKTCYSGFYFQADHGADPEAGMKHAKITIRREGMEDIVVDFSQHGCIYLNFGRYNPEYVWDGVNEDDDKSYKPYTVVSNQFSEPSYFPYNYTSGLYAKDTTDCVTKNGGFVFSVLGKDCGAYYSPGAFCFCVGKMADDFVLFPGIEGYRLTKLYYEASCRAQTPYTIRTEDGSRVIAGGEYTVTKKTTPITQDINDMHVHEFTDTEAGARYRLNLEETYRVISIKDICLVYEK